MLLKIFGFAAFVVCGALILFWPEIKSAFNAKPVAAAPAKKSPMEMRIDELIAEGYREIGSFAVNPDGSWGEFTPTPEEAERRAKRDAERTEAASEPPAKSEQSK